jgi:hypothetical protein
MVPNEDGSRGLGLFLFQTPRDRERVATFAGADESAPFHRLDGIAIGGQRAYFFVIFQPPQNRVAAERISLKLVSVLDVRQQVLFSLGELQRESRSRSFLFRHSSRPLAGRLAFRFTQLDRWGLVSTTDAIATPEPKPRAVG